MIKLLIGEDEKLARESIKKLLERYFEDEIEIVAECDNGEDVIERALALRPDIILLDIHMPKKDGLEAAERIKYYYDECEIIIITANNEFEYAKKAIKLNVNDFLVKPYSIKTFKEALNKTLLKIDKKKGEKEERQELKKSLISIRTLSEKEFILDMINGRELVQADMDAYIKLLDMEHKFYRCGIYKIKDESKICETIEGMKKTLYNIDAEVMAGCYLDRVVYYLFSPRENELVEADKQLKKYLSDKRDKKIFAVTQTYSSKEDIIKAFKRAKRDLNIKIHSEDVYGYDIPYELENELFKLVLESNGKKVEGKIGEILLYIYHKNKDISSDFMKRYIKQLVLMVDRTVQQITSDEKRSVGIEETFNLINNAFSIDQYEKVLNNYVGESILAVKKYKTNKHVKVIEYAKRYIESNFNKNISLDDVSQQVGLSSNYLSKYFKKVVGVNFKDYATNIRIEKAKIMLMKDEGNITEISEKLGYTDVSYFSYAFKKKTGISPKEYYLNKRN